MPPKRTRTTGDPGEGNPPSKRAKTAGKPAPSAKPAAKPKRPTFPANPEHFAKVLSSNHSKWHLVN